jgi:cytoskeletal protein CcmA (bactofilin family)
LPGAPPPRTAWNVGRKNVANIGKSIAIKGDLTGNEDLVIEGKVEGKITLPSGQVTIGADGKVTADLDAKSVVIVGRVKGNVRATERAEIHSSGVLEGDVHAPRLVVQEGAVRLEPPRRGDRGPARSAPARSRCPTAAQPLRAARTLGSPSPRSASLGLLLARAGPDCTRARLRCRPREGVAGGLS